MEAKTLTSEKIQQLHEFCDFHNMKYYDVQIELVDHLASAIEELWETKPQLPFEEALVEVSEQFGVDPFHFSDPHSLLPFPIENRHANSGFDAITEARTKAMERKYNRMHVQYFFEFFKLPKLLLTIASTLILYVLFEWVSDKALAAGVVQVVFLLSFFLYWLLIYRKEVKLTIEADKRFMLSEHLRTWRNSPLIFAAMSPGMINAISKLFEIQDKFTFFNYISTELLVAFAITLYGIMVIVTGIYMPRRIKDDFLNEFPQFVKA